MSLLHPRDATAAVRAGIESDKQHGAVVPPLYLSTNFTFDGFEGKREYDYTRSGNPSRDQLGAALARLEGGAGAVITSSGMAALTTVVQLLQPGDLLIAPHDCYGGTWRLFDAAARKGWFEVAFVDQTDGAALDAALRRRPKMILVETPSNPLMRLVDLKAVAARAKAAGAIVVADNTFLSPALQKPIALGADLVVHSTTKYVNGHSDVVGGAVIASTAELQERMTWWANCLGLTGAPFDSFLTLRGLRTLGARMRVHQENAQAVAELLESSPVVERVHYPGLPSHPDHELARAQQSGFGGMLSFELGGGAGAVRAFLHGLRCFSLAESLGGVESLVAHPATMTHSAMVPEARARAGIGDGLLRLSVGIEDSEDLLADLRAALARVRGASRGSPVPSSASAAIIGS